MENSHIAAIEQAIENAYKEQSKLTPEVLALEGMNSPKVRHLLNNLGAISTGYFEIGSWKGASFCSTMVGNKNLVGLANDDFSEFDKNKEAQIKFLESAQALIEESNWVLVTENCWKLKDLQYVVLGNFVPDLYFFDGNHSEESHKQAVVQFFPMMADRFVFVVDDFGKEGSGFHQVQTGTRKGLEFMSKQYRVVKEWELPKSDGFWEGIGIFLIERI